MTSVSSTFGALLLGGLYASLLTGIVGIQVVIYFKSYPTDGPGLKLLVLVIWFLDTLHTALVWAGLWNYLINFFGQQALIDRIHWTISTTIVVTAILTFVVHCFFAHRIFRLSRGNMYLVIPIGLLALLRLASATATTSKMIVLETFHQFKSDFHWLFTLGLAVSSFVDIFITASLFFLLQTSRTNTTNLNAVIDILIRYAFETGTLTTAGTVVSMVCWLVMPYNLIFMGLHFVIAKFYANSILVTLNMRQTLRRARAGDSGEGGLHYLDSRRASHHPIHAQIISKDDSSKSSVPGPLRATKVQINIERTTYCEDLQ